MRAQGLKFRVYGNSSLNIKPGDLLDALQNGKLEMAVYPLVYAVPKVPEFSLAGLPGLVPNLVAAQALKNSEIYAILRSIAEENGIRILALLWNPGGIPIQDPRDQFAAVGARPQHGGGRPTVWSHAQACWRLDHNHVVQ